MTDTARELLSDEAVEPVRLRPLDLSNLLKHAWRSGADGDDWVDYDPTECAAYHRITVALASMTAERAA